MRERRNSYFLAGTALALVLAATAAPATAAANKSIDALVPLPEPANVAPITPADIGALPNTTNPASATDTKDATPSVALTIDQQIAERLRTALAKPGKKEQGIEAFYSARSYTPFWSDNGTVNNRVAAVAAFLAKADADGLDPADYPVPEFKSGADASALADAELKLTSTVLTYARHAATGRIHFSRVSADIYYDQTVPEAADVLGKLTDAKDVAKVLDSFNPQHPAYQALKAKLAEARALKAGAGPKRIAAGPVLKITKDRKGQEILMRDDRVPLLRERFSVSGDATDTTYDKAVADAVKKFQQQHGLGASGQLTNATIDAINGPKRDRDADIILANMERWRWTPHDLGNAHVILNIPDFTLKVVKDGAMLWTTRVVVGKPSTPTPMLSETMKYITVNPTWNVPPSIVYNEYLPLLQQDSTILERMGLKLTQNRDGSVHIHQPPGEANALGRIRFNFPNRFLVYQHDTPNTDKPLFERTTRAYSHGCQRVQNPAKYAEVLLSIALPQEHYTEDRIKRMFGTGESDIKFQTLIPVHLTYQTAFVDDAGKLQIRDDLYGRDARLLAALKGDDRKMADMPVERAQSNYARPSVTLPARYAYGSGGSSFGFFERLFGSGPSEPRQPIRQQQQQRRTFAR